MAEVVERRIPQQVFCYYDVYVPDGEIAGPRPLLIALHGYGGDKASMMRAARRINERDFVIASLQGMHQHIVPPEDRALPLKYAFGWLTSFRPEESVAIHHSTIMGIIHTLEVERTIDASQVYLLGFSQAVALNFRFAFTRPDKVKGVIAICGGIPGDWAEEGKYRAGDVDVLYIAGARDEFYPCERIEQFADALATRARSVDLRVFDAGHEVPREAAPVIDAWLREKTAPAG
jgi:phospholipase/carboxylesterase